MFSSPCAGGASFKGLAWHTFRKHGPSGSPALHPALSPLVGGGEKAHERILLCLEKSRGRGSKDKREKEGKEEASPESRVSLTRGPFYMQTLQ